jgi:hypothetical protein
VNEIRILFFGSVTEISSTLLYLLGVVEVRAESSSRKGFYLIETRFGQESIRPLSLDLTDFSAKDVLIYRYLSDDERTALQDDRHPRRFFVLLHNLFSLEYISGEIKSQDHSRFNFLVDMSNNDLFKPFPYASRQLPSKNFYRIAKVKTTDKSEVKSGAGLHLPLFFLIILKFLINPINEIKRLAIITKHSNMRVLSRGLELVLFIDFVLRAIVFHTFRMLGLRLFYRSAFFAGIVKVVSIKGAYFFRHVVLMSGYKVFGVAVDGFNFLIRLKDAFVTTVYYRFLHRLYFKMHALYFKTVHAFYHRYVKKVLSFLFYKGLLAAYYWTLPRLNSVFLKLQITLRYKIPHYLTMGYYRTYGVVYDFAMFAYRFTKLILLYPVRKIYWFGRFQYEKRLKKFLV